MRTAGCRRVRPILQRHVQERAQLPCTRQRVRSGAGTSLSMHVLGQTVALERQPCVWPAHGHLAACVCDPPDWNSEASRSASVSGSARSRPGKPPEVTAPARPRKSPKAKSSLGGRFMDVTVAGAQPNLCGPRGVRGDAFVVDRSHKHAVMTGMTTGMTNLTKISTVV